MPGVRSPASKCVTHALRVPACPQTYSPNRLNMKTTAFILFCGVIASVNAFGSIPAANPAPVETVDEPADDVTYDAGVLRGKAISELFTPVVNPEPRRESRSSGGSELPPPPSKRTLRVGGLGGATRASAEGVRECVGH